MKTITAYGIGFILLLHVAGCNGHTEEKYFTGEIEYRYTYESNVLNTDSLAKERPVKGIFRYDLANYQSRFQGKDTFTYYYSGSLNKALSQSGNSENYTCEDYGLVTDSVISWKLYPAGEKVLGQVCDVLELQKKNSLVLYYVSRAEKIAPATYQKHKAYNWDVYGEKSNGGLILKMEHRFKVFTMKGIATNLVNQENNFKAFEIDENTFIQFCKGDK
ncbi:MAG: hypothetical protein IPH68_03395 [Chitinophagaceae bacterium]|nr:hypothetical protein [Chitinophagaceae bacterium]MBK7558229.1 hypothetical protein [Chitinophagaceae bacterium]MBK9531932.1 hypothetical protein [Chitinophagaceae bacterium]HQW92451.1 hypothetical protein [Ferruginibacter sp.]